MEERLIIAVQGFPEIYDLSSPHYFDTNKRHNAWRHIALELGITGQPKARAPGIDQQQQHQSANKHPVYVSYTCHPGL
ncbi:hypothetical protein F2P79_008459 [Pimephales promelas]|nr:hypothetical protein F2P79_008459 [Pimephales promelas]